jgi:hypothetical protein
MKKLLLSLFVLLSILAIYSVAFAYPQTPGPMPFAR